MLLRKLVLHDFGLYRGEQVIELAPRSSSKRQPIVLIGGHNGAGKTTILDAVRLCLYGRLALGTRVSDAEYHGYLRDRIHRDRASTLNQPASAAVAVEFDYSRGGETATYLVRRSWEPKGASSVTEVLEVLRNGQPLDDVESQFWPDFIRSLIPPGVSQLFFFDGEKIKRLAEAHTEAEALADSVKSLLGLDLVERLQTDLDIYCARQMKKTADGEAAARLAEYIAAEQTLGTRREEVKREEQELATKLQLLNVEIERAEQKLAQRGEGLANQREEMKARRASIEASIEANKNALRELCEGALPLLMCPSLARDLGTQLDREAELMKWTASRDQIGATLKAVEKRLSAPAVTKKLGADKSAKGVIAAEIAALSTKLTELPKELRGVGTVHALSSSDHANITQLLAETRETLPRRVRTLSKQLRRSQEELETLVTSLDQVPDGAELSPHVKKLSRLQADHATCVADMARLAEQRAEVENEFAAVRRKKDKLLAEQADARTLGERVALAYRARAALDAYLVRLTEAKVAELEGIVLECFRRICRKTDLVATLSIDPKTFEVTLKDPQGRVLPREALSAGEKQMFAIALLWSLARVSGRPLPMIIDTPLGRLDSIHRQKLMQHYFPVASHQVIVLSTDTEVDREYFDQLRPHISRTISLANHQGQWTEATSGYFWTKEVADVGTAA